MSAEATGWVFKYSPLVGTEFMIHLAIADSVNDQRGNEFWMKQAKLAVKARCTRQKVCTTVARMVNDGLLVEIDEGADRRKAKHQPRSFRFLMPGSLAQVYDPVAPDGQAETHAKSDVASVDIAPTDVASVDIAMSPQLTSADVGSVDIVLTQGLTQSEPKLFTRAALAASFVRFYATYPRKRDRVAAERAWTKAVKVDSPEVIIAGAVRYAAWVDARGIEMNYVKYPATWLNAGAWLDDLTLEAEAPRPKPTKTDDNRQRLIEGVEARRKGGTVQDRMRLAREQAQPTIEANGRVSR